MKFLSKKENSTIIQHNLSYNNEKDREQLRGLLLSEQLNFCAYSEQYIRNTDSRAIEHFDPRLKYTSQDNYLNWYVCITWMNEHKPKKLDDRFLPILSPSNSTLVNRIKYEEGIYLTTNKGDTEAENLIAFLGWNKYEVKKERDLHIERVKMIRKLCGADENMFIKHLTKDKWYLSFITALEYELEMNLFELL